VRDSPFEDMTADRVQPLLDVHLKGAFHVTRPAWKAMQEQGYGRSQHDFGGRDPRAENISNYGTAKTAPIAATRMLAHSIGGAGPQDDEEAQAVLDDLVGQFVQKLDPALVAPVAAFLAHQDCPVSGEIYTVGAGHVARFFIGRTKGFHRPGLSVEDVRDNLDPIRDEADYTVPRGPADEMGELFGTLMSG
jgi:NAD(P)-dependent dehydrogenase (short-subunit alcohol dehydrogenase family)